MSFNHDTNHIPLIDRTNYEEYFLLYVDEELTAAEQAAVWQFVADNPDLRAELNLLISTKLPAEPITFAGKQELLAKSKINEQLDESILLYLDDELPAAQKVAFEQDLLNQPSLRLQYEELIPTKLDKNDHIPFPYKQQLYKTAKRPPTAYLWLRIAAVIILVIGAALLWQLPPATSVAPLTANKPYAPATVQPAIKQSVIAPPADTATTGLLAVASKPEAANNNATKVTTAHNSDRKPIAKDDKEPPASQPEEATIALHQKRHLPASITISPVGDRPNMAEEIINELPVTSATPPAYTITNAAYHTMDPGEEVADDNGNHKAPLKSFFRKATRFIERTTNIRPENEDDRLLIGAVAINLK